MQALQSLWLIFALAVIVEGLVEYLGAPVPTRYKPYVAAAAGVLLCLAYGADLLAQLGYTAAVPTAGQVLTGLLIGRGSNYLNDLVSRLQVVRTPAAPVEKVIGHE